MITINKWRSRLNLVKQVRVIAHFLELHEVTSGGAGVPEDKASYTVGPWLTFDPQTERFTGEKADAANALLKDPNNKGFEVPDAKNV